MVIELGGCHATHPLMIRREFHTSFDDKNEISGSAALDMSVHL
jgi:hypothetical protein